ncbi:uncharacterized protein N7515_001976 [Penicillium bovifimosum]|uniref:BHLH domain-containing protein n=1 Tax=Penicillium bovifimosum TaxID=126998 RepID=A0A9W9L984_9EURO|nr:uncharacterized protein N7515_001976 [Penicillium bovifimosum]KAJ5143189.1 hypothetical protein N7515_001976 [Penicillium bovifimosum]
MATLNQTFQTDLNNLTHCCPQQPKQQMPRLPLEEGLQWGSDPSFCYHGFSCPIGTWTEDRLVQNLMRNMASICTSVNIGFDIPETTDSEFTKPCLDPMQLNGFTLPMFQPSLVPVPRDERLSETPSSPLSSSSSSQGQRSSSASSFPSDIGECTRRASCARAANKVGVRKRKCVQKAGQKLCHCRSEKRRREIIGERYKELCSIVPGLQEHSYTRKYVLEEAALWIQSLLKGNDELRKQLADLEGQGPQQVDNVWSCDLEMLPSHLH